MFAKEFGEHVYSRLGGETNKDGKAERKDSLMGDVEGGIGRSRAGSITVDVEMSQGFNR